MSRLLPCTACSAKPSKLPSRLPCPQPILLPSASDGLPVPHPKRPHLTHCVLHVFLCFPSSLHVGSNVCMGCISSMMQCMYTLSSMRTQLQFLHHAAVMCVNDGFGHVSIKYASQLCLCMYAERTVCQQTTRIQTIITRQVHTKAQTDMDRCLPGNGGPLQLMWGTTAPGQRLGKMKSRKRTAWMLLWWKLVLCLCPSARFLTSCQIM